MPTSEPTSSGHDFTDLMVQRSLAPKLHHIVQLRVAAQIASITETALRAEACRRCGWSDDQIRAASIRNIGETFSELEKLALHYADEITRTPIDIDPQTVKQLQKYLSRADLMELTASIAMENLRCRLTDANSRLQ